MPDERSTEANVRAGIAVIGVILAAGAVLWAGMAFHASRQREYVVWFTPEQGVYGLKEGCEVRVGGVLSGEVCGVHPRFVDGAIESYDVTFRIRADVPLFQGVRIEPAANPVSGDASIEIASVGDANPPDMARGAMGRLPLPDGTRIKGDDVPPYRTLMGHRGGRYLRDLLARAEKVRQGFASMGDDLPRHTESLRRDLDQVRAAMRTDFTAWKTQFEEARERASAALAKLGQGKDPAPDALVPQLTALRNEVPDVTDAERERAKFVAATLTGAISTLDGLGRRSGDFAGALQDAEHSLQKGMADFSIASQELDATTSEALLTPWRLFASPGAAQAARMRAIDDARVYAEAAVDFNRAMQGIRTTLERDAALLGKVPGLADLMRTRLDSSAQEFESRTERFIELLIGAPGASPHPASPMPMSPVAGDPVPPRPTAAHPRDGGAKAPAKAP